MVRQLGFPFLLVVTLFFSGCKSKSQDAAPTPPAKAAAQPAEPLPATDETLSVAQQQGTQCQWVRLEAGRGSRQNLFTFEGGCELVQLAWSQDGRKGAVLQSFEDKRSPLAWTVDLVAGQGTPLPLPEVGRVTELGFDAEGRPVALVSHYESPGMKPPERVEENGQNFFAFEGKKYPFEVQDGLFGLAHAYRREGTTWKHVESRVSSFEWNDSSGTEVLELAKKLGPNTKIGSKEGSQTQKVSPEEEEALNKSAPELTENVGPRGEDVYEGDWVQLALPGGSVYYLAEALEEPSQTLPLRWSVGGKFVEPEKLALPKDAAISLAAQGNVLLISSGQVLRVYDVGQKKHLLSLEAVYLPRFWPRASASLGKAGGLSQKLDQARVALDLLEKSTMKLEDGGESCAQLAEAGTVGALVKKARATAAEWSVRCEGQTNKKAWTCQARFSQRGDEEGSDGPSMSLSYSVDDATGTIQPGSLACQMAG